MDAERLGGLNALAGERQPVRATEAADAEWLDSQCQAGFKRPFTP